MLNLKLKSMLILSLTLLSAQALAAPGFEAGTPLHPTHVASMDGTDNPFADGTNRKLLSPKDRYALREFADTSKARLERALRKADGESVAVRAKILLAAIRDVSINSSRMHGQSELLMRFALNQALDLTYGVPTADGQFLVHQGVLINTGYVALMSKILEDSVRLALTYYTDDRKAIDSGNLLALPFNRFSTERLKMARERWVAVIGDDWGTAYDLQVAVLYQWMDAANHEQNLHRVELADELTQTNDVLASLPPPSQRPGQGQQLAAIVRGVLRDQMHWLSNSLAAKESEMSKAPITPNAETKSD